jgi:hypothetical protein
VSGRCDDTARLGGSATAASLVAGGPVGPARSDAVDGTRVSVARLLAHQAWARIAAVAHALSDSAVALGKATAACKTAGAEIAPFGDNAIDRAGVRVALLSEGVVGATGATDTAVGGGLDDGPSLRSGSRTAGFGAIGPSVPTGDDAIDGAGVSVASLLAGEVGACDAAVAHGGSDSASLVLQATAASEGAGAPVAPFADNAVDRASVGVARISRRVDAAAGAADTTMGSSLDDGPCLGGGTGAARLGAIGPSVPVGDNAVHGARVCIADLHTSEYGTCSATVAHGGRHSPAPVRVTAAASDGTSAPSAPFGDDAVDGAAVGVAGIGCGVGVATWALDATVCESLDDRPSLGGGSGTTGLVAGGPSVPTGDNAIDGADVGVASLLGLQIRACDATVAHGLGDSTGLVRVTAAAIDGTSAPSAPFGDDAVDGAAVGVAVSGNRVRFATGATNTSVESSLDYGASLRSGADAAGPVAGGPSVPAGDDAIDRAGVGIARLIRDENRAGSTAMAHGLGDSTVLVRVATAASESTSAVVAPFGDNAIDRAAVGVARVAHGVDLAAGATDTAVGGGLDDGPSLGSGSRTASLVAGGPTVPTGDDAIDGARMSVASLLMGERGASSTAVAHGGADGTVTVLGATTASCCASAVRAKCRNNTVDRTVVRVAGIGECMDVAAGAADTAVGSGLDDRPRLGALTAAARLGAIGPSVPTGDNAIDGAGVSVASLGGSEGRASSAVALGAMGDSACLGDSTGVAKLGANAEHSPIRHSAIFVVGGGLANALFSVARRRVGESRALNATEAT